MPATGLHHVSICVDDIDAAVGFYTSALGFTVLPRPDFGFPGAWLDTGGGQVHLMQMPSDAPAMNHFALQVDDLAKAIEELESKGVAVDASPYFPGAGHQAFLRDPSGNMIELNQPD